MNGEDQTLSRLAAKVIGLDLGEYRSGLSSMPDDYLDGFMVGEVGPFGFRGYYWNPLEHDGDALRLAFMLGMKVDIAKREVWYCKTPALGKWLSIGWDGGIEGLRRAIVLAAAEMGENTHA